MKKSLYDKLVLKGIDYKNFKYYYEDGIIKIGGVILFYPLYFLYIVLSTILNVISLVYVVILFSVFWIFSKKHRVYFKIKKDMIYGIDNIDKEYIKIEYKGIEHNYSYNKYVIIDTIKDKDKSTDNQYVYKSNNNIKIDLLNERLESDDIFSNGIQKLKSINDELIHIDSYLTPPMLSVYLNLIKNDLKVLYGNKYDNLINEYVKD